MVTFLEPFGEGTVREGMAAYRDARVVVLPDVGHYPMQEAPVALVGALERYRPYVCTHETRDVS